MLVYMWIVYMDFGYIEYINDGEMYFPSKKE